MASEVGPHDRPNKELASRLEKPNVEKSALENKREY